MLRCVGRSSARLLIISEVGPPIRLRFGALLCRQNAVSFLSLLKSLLNLASCRSVSLERPITTDCRSRLRLTHAPRSCWRPCYAQVSDQLRHEPNADLLIKTYRDKHLLKFITDKVATFDTNTEPRPVLLVDEVEQAYKSLRERRADDRSPLRYSLNRTTTKYVLLLSDRFMFLGARTVNDSESGRFL